MSHSRAKLNAFGRRLLIERICAGWRVRAAAAAAGISRQRSYVLLARFRREGGAAFESRSSRPHHSPRRTPERIERLIERARRRLREGPLRLSFVLHLARSTIYAVLRRLGLQRLRFFDPPRPHYRRYERPTPGDLVHIDTKKLGRIPEGGGKRFGPQRKGPGVGAEYIHVAVDDRTRLAYAERLGSERAADCAAFTARALRHFLDHGVRVRQVMTDNYWSYTKSPAFHAVLAQAGASWVEIPKYTRAGTARPKRSSACCCAAGPMPARTPATALGRSPSRTSSIRTITAVPTASSEGRPRCSVSSRTSTTSVGGTPRG